ncbi:MucBP domain-containing protein, partial [Enterococcus innesii]|uniref:MucBP domain-containing protein n=1 Tax=Enterococcus innesii TaxID=2839759 RepID=UPI003984BD54
MKIKKGITLLSLVALNATNPLVVHAEISNNQSDLAVINNELGESQSIQETTESLTTSDSVDTTEVSLEEPVTVQSSEESSTEITASIDEDLSSTEQNNPTTVSEESNIQSFDDALDVVTMPNGPLKRAICESLGIEYSNDVQLTMEDMAKVTSIETEFAGTAVLSSFEGIQYATNLQKLTVYHYQEIGTNQLSYLSGLKNLESIKISANSSEKGISDLSFISGLTSLKSISLQTNNITDLTPLSTLSNLEFLDLAYNNISDVTPLSSLKNLTSLSLLKNPLSNEYVASLGDLTNLKSLELGVTGVTEYNWISQLSNLDSLGIAQNNLTDDNVTPLSKLTSLTVLDLSTNNLTDLSIYKNMPKVQRLNAEQNNISDLTPLLEFKSVAQINLNRNEITDVTPLVEIAELGVTKYIMLQRNHIADISGLGKLLEDTDLSIDAMNQTITLPKVSVHKGNQIVIDNPFKSVDGTIPVLTNISSSGIYDETTNQVLVENIQAWSVSAQFYYQAFDSHFGYSGSLVQPIELLEQGAPVTVIYEDQEGNELAPSDTLSGDIGYPYETSAKTISGWTVTTTPENAQGTFSEEAQTVTYVYEKADASPVTVTYVDTEGNELATPETLSGKIGDPYTTNAKAIYGWAVTVTPENAQGTFSEEAQTVTYVYEKADASPVTVTYVDTEGNELATPETLSGKIGDPYTTNAKAIYGWAVTVTPENAQGTFSEEAQKVTYVYEKADASPVTVTYVDTEGNELAIPETLSGKIGAPYTTNAKAIYGWAVTVTPENAQGTFSEEAQTVTYVYEKADASPVIVTYVDSDGNELATPETLSGK